MQVKISKQVLTLYTSWGREGGGAGGDGQRSGLVEATVHVMRGVSIFLGALILIFMFIGFS